MFLVNILFIEINLIFVKIVMNFMGFEVGLFRFFFCEMELSDKEILKVVLNDNKLM